MFVERAVAAASRVAQKCDRAQGNAAFIAQAPAAGAVRAGSGASSSSRASTASGGSSGSSHVSSTRSSTPKPSGATKITLAGGTPMAGQASATADLDAATPADLADPANPCADAVPREHGHFFTEDGEFGSTDFNGDQVDDGSYEIVDDDTVSINGTQFGYAVHGDELTLQPPPVATDCSDFECQWSIMVAMPGQTLIREE